MEAAIICVLTDDSCGYAELRECFRESYAAKNKADPGAEPMTTADKPLYIPLKPPDFINPCDDCLQGSAPFLALIRLAV